MHYPLIAAESKGGPYDDVALVAGICLGEIGYQMHLQIPHISTYVYTALLDQFDLIAMHYGYLIYSEPWTEHEDPNKWSAMVAVLQPQDEMLT